MARRRELRPPAERLVTSRGAMERLEISRRTLYRWGELGLITTWKVGGTNRYDIAELDRMITRRVAS